MDFVISQQRSLNSSCAPFKGAPSLPRSGAAVKPDAWCERASARKKVEDMEKDHASVLVEVCLTRLFCLS